MGFVSVPFNFPQFYYYVCNNIEQIFIFSIVDSLYEESGV